MPLLVLIAHIVRLIAIITAGLILVFLYPDYTVGHLIFVALCMLVAYVVGDRID